MYGHSLVGVLTYPTCRNQSEGMVSANLPSSAGMDQIVTQRGCRRQAEGLSSAKQSRRDCHVIAQANAGDSCTVTVWLES